MKLPTQHDCKVGTYQELKSGKKPNKKKCRKDGEAHHVIPDAVYRTYDRNDSSGLSSVNNELQRMNGAPTMNDGIAICMSKKKHKKLHKRMNRRIKALGEDGVADLDEIKKICQEELANVKPPPPSQKCIELANDGVERQVRPNRKKKARTNMTKVEIKKLKKNMKLKTTP